MIRTALTLVAVCVISLAVNAIAPFPGEPYCLTMLVVDALAAAVVLIRPAGKAQALVGATLACQMGLYAGRLLNGENADINHLWWGLSVLAFAQLFLVGGWWVHERVNRRRHFHRWDPVTLAAHRKGLE